MRKLFLCISLISLSYFSSAQIEDVIIVVHKSNASISLTSNQIKNLYMGGVVDNDLYPVSLEQGNLARTIFNTRILGLTESRIQSYWAQMRFGGRINKPIEISDPQAMVEYISSHPESIGYLPEETHLPNSLAIIYSTSD